MGINITFERLTKVDPAALIAHMSDPLVATHMPLLDFAWTDATVRDFVAKKETAWGRDGLGHWAFFLGDEYVGWGGFEHEGDGEWDFALVLRPEHFGIGTAISRQALAFARADERIRSVVFLLAPTRRSLRALERLGAEFVGETVSGEKTFLQYRLQTA